MKWVAIQFGNLAFLSRPHLLADRVVDDADHDLVPQAQRNRDAKMRDAVEIIHRAIERIDHPLMFVGLIADDSFFAVSGWPGNSFKYIVVINFVGEKSVSNLMFFVCNEATAFRHFFWGG